MTCFASRLTCSASDPGLRWNYFENMTVLANGKLYIRDQDTLFCYDIKAK